MPSKAFKMIKQGLEEAIAYSKGDTRGSRVHTFTAEEIVELRTKLGLSQRAFAEGFQVPIGTVRGWEQGRRMPRGAASVLLTLIGRDPERIIKQLWPAMPDAANDDARPARRRAHAR